MIYKWEKIGIDTSISWMGLNPSDHTQRPADSDLVDEDNTLEAYVQKVNDKYLLVIETKEDGSTKAFVDLDPKPFAFS